MTKQCVIILAGLILMTALATTAEGYESGGPKTVVVHNGSVTLHALLWRPQGHGPFPAILFNHGSGRTREELKRLGPYEQQADILGQVFARHGYVSCSSSGAASACLLRTSRDIAEPGEKA